MSLSLRAAPLLILLAVLLCNVVADFGGLSSRGVAALSGCENTVSGRWYMADDQGRVCSRASFDHSTGCCPTTAEQYHCARCDPTDECCSGFEHCVSCCMSPPQRPETRMLKAPRGMGKPETGLWKSPFEFCRATCRTSSRSTQHENAFIDERRFCFSKHGRPLVPLSSTLLLSKHVKAVTGPVGSSCDDVCHAHERKCAGENFAAINNCNALRKAFGCEAGSSEYCAGCGPFEANSYQFPGYVVADAPKEEWPTFCYTFPLPPMSDSTFPIMGNCSYVSENIQRLCPCAEVPGLTEQSAQVDALSSGASQPRQGGLQR